MKIRNMKIGTRLGMSFGLMLILIAGIATIALFASKTTQDSLHETVNRTRAKSEQTAVMRQSLFRQNVIVNSIGMFKELDDMQKDVATIFQEQKRYKEKESTLLQLGLDTGEQAIDAEMQEQEKKIAPILKETQEFLTLSNAGLASKSLSRAGPILDKWLNAVDRLVELQSAQIGKRLDEFEETAHDASMVIVVIASLAIVLAATVGWLLTRSIVLPLRHAVGMAKGVARGDLTLDIKVSGKDETGQLLEALREMNNSLVTAVRQVRTGTENIGIASREIASGNADLSSRTEAQASSLQETAASMEQLTSTVKQNAENAQQANHLAASASNCAVQGGVVVEQVVQTMASIKDSSRKIVDIISVIDGIAFQTNILALNAAVEAARAGENGRGFAVVASEVRNLAQRSATAAKEIKQLINDSVAKVDAGNALVDAAGKSMSEIVRSIQRVVDIMSEITAASVEQSSGITEVNRAVSQMDEMTQQNAALVEQAAAAADAMQLQANGLFEAVGVFKLPALAEMSETGAAYPAVRVGTAQRGQIPIPLVYAPNELP